MGKKYQVVPRSPADYSGKEATALLMHEMHKYLIDRVNSVVNSGKIPDASKCKLRVFKWSKNTSFRDDPSIVQSSDNFVVKWRLAGIKGIQKIFEHIIEKLPNHKVYRTYSYRFRTKIKKQCGF